MVPGSPRLRGAPARAVATGRGAVRVGESSLIDLTPGERTGTNMHHLALTVDHVDLDELAASGRVKVQMGPADLFGARGMGRGLYVTDPDGNLVELRTYPPDDPPVPSPTSSLAASAALQSATQGDSGAHSSVG